LDVPLRVVAGAILYGEVDLTQEILDLLGALSRIFEIEGESQTREDVGHVWSVDGLVERGAFYVPEVVVCSESSIRGWGVGCRALRLIFPKLRMN